MEKKIEDFDKVLGLPNGCGYFWAMSLVNFGTFFLFVFGIHQQYEFMQRLKYRDIIRPTELAIDSVLSVQTGESSHLVADGYIDSVSVSLNVRRGDLIRKNPKKKFLNWMDILN